MSTPKRRTEVPAKVVRDWARRKGFQVGERGHLPPKVVKAYNRTHRTVYIDRNPWRAENRKAREEEVA